MLVDNRQCRHDEIRIYLPDGSEWLLACLMMPMGSKPASHRKALRWLDLDKSRRNQGHRTFVQICPPRASCVAIA